MTTLRLTAAGIIAIACLACGSYGSDDVGDNPLDWTRLVDRLRRAGAAVDVGGQVQQPFFSVPGRTLAVDGQNVQVFEYATEAAMQRDGS